MGQAEACVVVIDANAHMRRLVATLLSALNIRRIIEVRSAAAAAPIVAFHQPHLVVMDWSTDQTDSLLFVHRMRRGEICSPATPVLAMAREAHHAVLDTAREAGIDKVIPKPLAALDLIACARQLITRSMPGGWQAAE